jgi:nitric oxide dioxygenase
MTPKQKLIVQSTFEQVQLAIPHIADRFYSRLFRKHDDLKSLFTNSQHKQAIEFGRSLGEIVHRLDSPTELKSYLQLLAKRHEEFGLTDVHYIAAGKAFVFAIRHALGRSFNRNVANAWNAFFREIGRYMSAREEM